MLALLLAIHVAAAVFWVGGMAFAYLVLRPSAGALDPPMRLGLWRRVFGRFLPWVGLSVIALLVSGYAILFMQFGGFRRAPMYVHIMQGTGLLMMLLFAHLYFAPWPRLRAAVDAGTFPDAAKHLNQIRMLVAVNLVLGTITVLVGSTGRYW
jgi:uncharacterized membrane protein